MISTNKTQIVLASTSEIRRKLLKRYNIEAKYVKHSVNEEKEIEKYKKEKYKLAGYLAKKKIESIKHKYENSTIIGSDQIILCNNNLVNKPTTEYQAIRNLLLLQGKCHTLISAICILTPTGEYKMIDDKAKVYMRKLQESDIKAYVKNNKSIVYATSGSYKIENDILNCIERTEGEMETILGFPVKKTLSLLKKYQ